MGESNFVENPVGTYNIQRNSSGREGSRQISGILVSSNLGLFLRFIELVLFKRCAVAKSQSNSVAGTLDWPF